MYFCQKMRGFITQIGYNVHASNNPGIKSKKLGLSLFLKPYKKFMLKRLTEPKKSCSFDVNISQNTFFFFHFSNVFHHFILKNDISKSQRYGYFQKKKIQPSINNLYDVGSNIQRFSRNYNNLFYFILTNSCFQRILYVWASIELVHGLYVI